MTAHIISHRRTEDMKQYDFNFDYAYVTKEEYGYNVDIEKDCKIILSLHFVTLDGVTEFCCLNGGFIDCPKEIEDNIRNNWEKFHVDSI